MARRKRKRAVDAAALERLLDFWLLLNYAVAAAVADPWLMLVARMELGEASTVASGYMGKQICLECPNLSKL